MNTVGKRSPERSYSLGEILTEKQIEIILGKVFKDVSKVEVMSGSAAPATDGIAGFLGEHVRVTLSVRVEGTEHTVRLFLKRVPTNNRPKAEFIDGNNYFRRERLILQLLEEMGGGEGPHPWCVKSLLVTDSLVVMPDLAAQGYAARPLLQTLDLPHVLLTATSIARFHAAFANYETDKIVSSRRPYEFYAEYEHLLTETTFQDTPWLRAGAKLTADLLDAFSSKYRAEPRLEDRFAKLFVEACASLDRDEDSLNVVVHKDLWINNILYRHEDGAPADALLIDYQCVRYAPPAFDLTSFLYLNTTRRFRDAHETQIFKHYFEAFTSALKEATKERLEALGYDEGEFLRRCERSRMFAAFEALAIYPMVLMDARSAQRVFDDPDTFLQVVERDRSAPVIAYAKLHPLYRERILEVSEEFVERFVVPIQSDSHVGRGV